MPKIAKIWRYVPKRQELVLEDCEGKEKRL
jgi:hypothetical protein